MTYASDSTKRPIENGTETSSKKQKKPSSRVKRVKPKANQNSAAVLSLWHCILAWFYMSCEKEHTDDILAKDTMNEVYDNMKAIRATIHHNSLQVESIVSHFDVLVQKLDQARWNSVIKSMMHELIEMLRVLKGNKDEFLNTWEFEEMDEVEKRKFNHLSCLLTIWYWLAAWSNSSGESQEMKSAKDGYFHSVELYRNLLNDVLFMDSHAIADNETKASEKFTIMIESLVKLLRTDPQHWIDVLDHFVRRMAHAGSLRGQVKNVWEEARAIRDKENEQRSRPSQTLFEENPLQNGETQITTTVQDPSAQPPMLVHGLGILLKNVAGMTPLSAVADKIPDAVSLVYDDIKKGDVKDIVDHIPNVVGEFVGPEGKQIAQGVVKGAEYIGEHVVDGVKGIAHVLGEGVHEFSKGSIEELPPKLQEIIKLFQSAENPRAKYQQLLFYANNLPALDEKYKTKENKVEGCVSQVWVRAFLDDNFKDRVYYEADSDSVIDQWSLKLNGH